MVGFRMALLRRWPTRCWILINFSRRIVNAAAILLVKTGENSLLVYSSAGIECSWWPPPGSPADDRKHRQLSIWKFKNDFHEISWDFMRLSKSVAEKRPKPVRLDSHLARTDTVENRNFHFIFRKIKKWFSVADECVGSGSAFGKLEKSESKRDKRAAAALPKNAKNWKGIRIPKIELKIA